MAKAPSYKGFASYDMKGAENDSYVVEKIGSTIFRVYHIKSVQVFGLRAGTQRLEPVEIDTDVRYKIVSKNEGQSSGLPKDTIFPFVAKSEALNIIVKPLPVKKTKEPLMGIGTFSIRSSLSSPVIPALKADTISFTIMGKGNWHQVISPTINWPEGLEVFEPKIKEELDAGMVPVGGTRTIQYPVVATKTGTYSLPPISFSVFNPETETYDTIQSETVSWQVTNRETGKPLKSDTGEAAFSTTIFSKIAVILFPVAAIALIIILLGRKSGEEAAAKRKD
jgi:hypothetical protein